MKKLVNGEYVDLTQEEIAAREAEISADFEASKLPHLDSYTDSKLNGGITVNDVFIATGEKDRSLINGAVTRALLDGDDNITYPYYPTGGSKIDLTNAQYKAIGAAIAQHVQKCLDAADTVEAAIANYNTLAEIEEAFDDAYAA